MKNKLAISIGALLLFCNICLSQTTNIWPTSTPEAQGMDSKTLADAVRHFRKDSVNIHSLIIIKNGHTVLDAYFYPFKKRYAHDMASATKSVTALLVGIAIEKGFIKDENEPALDFFPEVVERNDTLKSLTVKNLLNMASGFSCSWNDGEKELGQMRSRANWVKYMFGLPFETMPGTSFSYCSGNYYLLSEILSRSTKMTAHAFAQKYLFGPLGFGESYWQANSKGVNHGWGDLCISTTDMAKIGYLILKDGKWNDRQVISKAWLDKIKPLYKIQKTESYGYGWWLDSENPDEIQAVGRGGQRLFIFKESNMVIATTGGGFEAGDIDNIALASIAAFDKSKPPGTELARATAEMQMPVASANSAGNGHFSIAWLNKDYLFTPNPLGFSAVRFEERNKKYIIIIKLNDGNKEEHVIGMDGRYEVSKERTFGLPVAVEGHWINDTTIAIDYNELSRIQDNKLNVSFSGNSISLTIDEQTKHIHETLRGRYQ